MDANWKPVIFLAVAGALMIGLQFGAYAISEANAASRSAHTDNPGVVKKRDHGSDEQHERAAALAHWKMCKHLANNVTQAYRWDKEYGSDKTRIALDATINTYDLAGRKCKRLIYKILEEEENRE